MSVIIAGIYEIEKEIGSGGGGIVYLGRHLRLEKQVVLKADKRTLSTGTEALRREVDMLKGLSHTYIPQVHDFVQQDGVVYTVMDFIEGESLDKLLKRNQRPTQPQVIRWACQLLEALSYLHSQPPHGILHGDIKPANIMLRPGGDICLIDFNIALALGENGAVKAGFSRGYASPEHYGAEAMRSGGQESVKPPENGKTGKRPGGWRRGQAATGQPGTDKERPAKAGRRMQTDTGGMSEESDRTCVDMEGAAEESDRTQADTKKEAEGEETVRDAGSPAPSSGSARNNPDGIMLDVRSDIYSLGATLYHLLSGHRPEQNALEVKPLEEAECSPAVAAIIQKAMAPEPSMRYQSAEEMLTAFLQLYQKDRRVILHKRRMGISAAFLAAMFLLGGACAFAGLKQLEERQTALTLSEYSANALAGGDVTEAVRQAMQAIPSKNGLLKPPATAQAQYALTDALGVYDLADGFKALDCVELPSAPFDITMSPDGSLFAVVYAYEAAVFNTENLQKLVTLQTQESALADCVFVDERYIIYAGFDGVTAYDLEERKTLWTGEPATTLSVSGDGLTVAAVNRDDDHAVIYHVPDGARVRECSFKGKHMQVAANDIFADPGDHIFTLNEDGSMLAVSFSDGGLSVFDLTETGEDLILFEESGYRHFEGGFYDRYFAFAAQNSGGSLFGLADTIQGEALGSFESQERILLRTDKNGIYLASGNLLAELEPVLKAQDDIPEAGSPGITEGGIDAGTEEINGNADITGQEMLTALEEKELAFTGNVNITSFSVWEGYVLTATDDNGFSFYDKGANLLSAEISKENCDFVVLSGGYACIGNRNEPSVRLLKLEDHRESELLSYDARYAHDEARLSQDGRTVMLFDIHSFCIYDREGRLVCREELPDAGHIYDQQFIRGEENSWLEVTWYDGVIRRYSAEDGSLISEESGQPPSKELYEEFYTQKYRIASSLHTAPEVYDLKSGKLVGKLEEDSYLTYVTQTGEFIITEYISASGERYGLLLDSKLQKLAFLPGLCDVVRDMLVFDYNSGNLRQCRLYSLQELTALGETYLNNQKGEF